jgi:hypothetical protein
MPWNQNNIPFDEYGKAAIANEHLTTVRDRKLFAMSRDPLAHISTMFNNEHMARSLMLSSMSISKHQPKLPAIKLAQ